MRAQDRMPDSGASRRTLRRTLLGALAVAVVVGLVACGGGGSSQPAGGASKPGAGGTAGAAPAATGGNPAAAPTAVPAPVKLTMAYSTASAANSPLQLAQDQGIFRKNGLEVELLQAMANAGPAALVSGQAQVLSAGCAEGVAVVSGGADAQVLLTSINRMQYMLAGSPTIAGRQDLRGKRLAVSRLGSSSHLATKFIVKHLGFDPDADVSYLQVGNTPERVSALLAGSVDGSILSADEGSLIGAQPGMHIIVDMTLENIPYCGNALMTMRSYLRDEPETVRRVTRSVIESLVRFRRVKAEGVDAIARFLNEDHEKAERLWEVWIRLFPDKPFPDVQGIQFVLDEVGQSDPRAKSLVPEQIVDPTWVRELDQSGWIDQTIAVATPR
jgi:NitT/TauT family transport system substrate-binding protein